MKFSSMFGLALGAAAATFCVAPQSHAATLPAHFGNAIAGFSGTSLFNASQSGLTFSASVDYAVYAPGQFNVTFPGLDPSGGSQFVYAYQLSNVGVAAQRPIQALSVGVGAGQPHSNIGFLNENIGGIDPAQLGFQNNLDGSSSAVWTNNPQFTALQFGEVYVFTSTRGPGFNNASVTGGGLVAQGQLPSPVPEPASAMIVLGAVATIAGVRRHRRA